MSGPVLVPDTYGNVAHRLDTLEERLVSEDVRSRQPFQTRLFPVQEPKRVIPFDSLSPDAAKTARSTQERNAKARGRQRHQSLNPDDSEEIQKELAFPSEHLETRTVEFALTRDHEFRVEQRGFEPHDLSDRIESGLDRRADCRQSAGQTAGGPGAFPLRDVDTQALERGDWTRCPVALKEAIENERDCGFHRLSFVPLKPQ